MDQPAVMSLHPPKPLLTLRVGITGHRPNKLNGAAAALVTRQLPGVFTAIERAAAQVLDTDKNVYADASPVMRLINGFAEGADQIAVAACPPSWRIEAILPFPKDEYLNDFASSAGDGADVRDAFAASLSKASVVTELPFPHSGIRDQGYANAGGYMLRQIDVLIAVWDGKPPKLGGTGAIAREAFAGGIPVVWLAVGDERPPRLITAFDERGAPVADETDCTTGPLARVLTALISAPQPSATASDSETPRKGVARAALERYLGEGWRSHCFFAAYDGMKRVSNGNLPRLFLSHQPFAKRQHDWDAFLQAAPDTKDLHERISHVLLPRYIWADTLAVHFSHLYRSTYVLAYFLSALAVFIALLSVFIHEDGHDTTSTVLQTKAIFVACELVIIALILALVTFGRRLEWHERWLDYRALAEMLRHGRFLAFVSEFGRNRQTAKRDGDHEPPWLLWYIRATMREVGLPTAVMDDRYQSHILGATLVDEIAGPYGQLAYHRGNSKSAHNIDHLLHILGLACFVTTSAILFLFLLLFVLEHFAGVRALTGFLTGAKPYVTFLSAGLPALGAAVAGIRVHGDFEGSVESSDEMVDQLEALKSDYAMLKVLGTNLEATSETLLATARVMSEDLAAWQDLYGRKRLSLPA